MMRTPFIGPLRGALFIAALVSVAGIASAGEGERAALDRARAGLHGSPLHEYRHTAAKVTLAEAIRAAMANNPRIRGGDEAIAAAGAQRDETFAIGHPILDYEYRTAPVPNDVSRAAAAFFEGQWSWFHSVKLAVGVPLFTFGKLSIAHQLADQGIMAAQWDQRKVATGTAAQIRQLYYGLQFGEALAGVLLEAIDNVTEKLHEPDLPDLPPPADNVPTADTASAADGATDAAPPAKQVSPIDKLKMQLFRAELEKRLAELRKKQRVGLAALRVQMGLPAGSHVTLAHTALRAATRRADSLTDALAQMQATRAEAHLLTTGVAAKGLELDLERRKKRPDLGAAVFAEVGRTIGGVSGVTTTDDFSDPFHYTRAGVGLQLKGKWDLHGEAARVRKKEHEYYKARLDAGFAAEGLALEVREAHADLQTARVEMTRTRESAGVARRMLFLTKSNLDLGIGEQTDYVDALKMVLLTRGQELEAIVNFNLAAAKLDEKTGVIPYVADSLPE